MRYQFQISLFYRAQAKCEADFDNQYVYDEELTDKMISLSIDILGQSFIHCLLETL
jgi:hypothetical protein